MAKKEKTAAEIYREERKKRLAKAAKKNSRRSITSQSAKIVGRIITIIIVLAIVCTVAFVVVKQTGVIERSKTAFTIDGEKVSQAEYGYYYSSGFNLYYQYAQYGYITLDTSKPFANQPYTEDTSEIEGLSEIENPTWADFFEYYARQQIKSVKASAAAAKEAGIELSDHELEHVQSSIDSMSEQASQYNYSTSAYLKQNYGNGMNVKLFRHILEEQQLASAFQESKSDEFAEGLSKKEIDSEYKSNILSYGRISLLSFEVPAADETGDEGNTTYSEAALAAAKADADKIAEANSESEFNSLVKEVKKSNKLAAANTVTTSEDATYSDIQSLSSDSAFLSWASDTKTQAGETLVVEGESSSTVFFMVEPIHKASGLVESYDARHILIKFIEDEAEAEDAEDAENSEEITDSEDATEPAEKDEIVVEPLDLGSFGDLDFKVENKVDGETAQNKEAYKKIQDILVEYLNGEHGESAFGALAEKYTEDDGSKDNGGLYEEVTIGQFVAPFEEWCLEDGREEGDVGIVEYQGDNYKGYHLIYFVGKTEFDWKDSVKDALASEKLNDFMTEFVKESPEIENINDKVCGQVVEALDKRVKRMNSNSQQSASY